MVIESDVLIRGGGSTLASSVSAATAIVHPGASQTHPVDAIDLDEALPVQMSELCKYALRKMLAQRRDGTRHPVSKAFTKPNPR
jgi:hypothetical protein